MMMFYAHTAEGPDGARLPSDSGKWQPLSIHLRNVANLAAQFATPMGKQLADEAHLAGLLHDLGKYRNEFQSYLRGECKSSAETQHAIFGAAWASNEARSQLFATKLSIAGHHAGLHDNSELDENIAGRYGRSVCDDVPRLIKRLETELGPLPPPPMPPSWVVEAGLAQNPFPLEFYTRMIFSCVVDADRLDTAHWPDLPPRETQFDPEALLSAVLRERAQKAASNPESPLFALRNHIFEAALSCAANRTGFFSMTVPTGGGKTLASMAFALAHARANTLRRVIVVIPYLSIIEQNAAEYRRIFGDDIVLENHSGVRPADDNSESEQSRLELISENWDSPIIVTTSVQFLESLFASNPSRCRKLHRIARSVVIFDEVQTLPAHLLSPTFNVFRELAANYGTSFVFSSATQPAFRRGSSIPDGFLPGELREIAPAPEEMFQQLRRVTYHFPASGAVMDWPELAERLSVAPQVLCVVNLTRHAKDLWENLSRLLPPEQAPIHLSSAMCAEHRMALLETVRTRLRDGHPCHVVSTQLIEAGVDVDFPEVWRALGPLDSIVQVAGRCNREGRRPKGDVHVFRPADHKLPLGIYGAATDQAAITLASLGDSLIAAERLATGSKVFSDYFDSLYSVVNTDYARAGESTIQDDRSALRFREVSRKARVIEDSGTPIVVQGDNRGWMWAASLIDEIRNREPTSLQPRFSRRDLRRLHRFMINVRHDKFQRLLSRQLIRQLLPNLEIYVLDTACYHPSLGLILENSQPDDFLV